MLTTIEIGEKIAVARKLKNLSQAQLAERLTISSQAVGKWERGESMPDIITFHRLAEILGTDLNYFAGEDTIISGTISSGTANDSETPQETSDKTGWNMSGSNWLDADFSGLQGLAEKFSYANIEKCRFVESELAGLVLKGNNIKDSDFSRSNLSNCHFAGANIEHDIFNGSDFSQSVFSKSNVVNCDFSLANLTGAVIKWSNFKKVDLNDTILYKTKFSFGKIIRITFNGEITECSFENCEFMQVIFDGVILRQCFFKNAKLRRAKFINCQADRLTYAFMKNCKADLTDVSIIEEGASNA
ncbi:MAG: pentapeptide repeat-containing protein [Clostridiales bacterium]|jgi:uncharacterized protein YjbI with pentapeptide repeats|nr:pentapeptide repeat-containing protein [Clostridiales bacterium]